MRRIALLALCAALSGPTAAHASLTVRWQADLTPERAVRVAWKLGYTPAHWRRASPTVIHVRVSTIETVDQPDGTEAWAVSRTLTVRLHRGGRVTTYDSMFSR